MNSVLDGTVTKVMIGKMQGIKYAYKNIRLNILKVKVRVVFSEMLPR